MKTIRFLAFISTALVVAGCASTFSLSSRSAGKVYAGTFMEPDVNAGLIKINIDSDECTGRFARSPIAKALGVYKTHAQITVDDQAIATVLCMVCASHRTLACDVPGTNGICTDGNGQLFDIALKAEAVIESLPKRNSVAPWPKWDDFRSASADAGPSAVCRAL